MPPPPLPTTLVTSRSPPSTTTTYAMRWQKQRPPPAADPRIPNPSLKKAMTARKTNMINNRLATIIMFLPLVASAFEPHVGRNNHIISFLSGKKNSPQKKNISGYESHLTALSGQNPEDNPSSEEGDQNTDAPTQANRKYTMARAGGRRPRTHSKSRNNNTENTKSGDDGGIFSVIRRQALPFFLLAVIVKLLQGIFGGNDTSNPNVVYYSSSVYQSTTYSRDRNVETTRKENFQSNIPGLVEKAKDYSKNEKEMGDNRYMKSIDEELVDLEDEMDSFLFQKW
mmetsp:Transcript_23472/g.42391  ORF Transcript_23472/g.42391 Transcript_23472/m.42391 type:complete len:283 (-) Transcript_23472:2349-3197(-)